MTPTPGAPATPPSPKGPLAAAGAPHRRIRKRIHLMCFLVFLALPFTNMMRFDIPRQRFFIAGFELWISEFSIVFFSLMFLMFLVAASAILYGRIYCSYACPQMIFSEWSVALEGWCTRRIRRGLSGWGEGAQRRASRGLFLGLLLVASVGLAVIFTSYFMSPKEVIGRLLHLDLVTVGGITGATVTLLTFLDLSLVKHRFCTTVCPYGYIQGMLQDKHTLMVSYQDETAACIHCSRCVKVCEMGIDIRESPFQIECVHCGDCVDACAEVLGKRGHPGLIHYTWGDQRAAGDGVEPWTWRLGLRDGKRWVLLLLLALYLGALGTALFLRRPVLVKINADRSVLFTQLPDGRVVNRIRFNFANRSSQPTQLRAWVEGLPGAELDLDKVVLGPGASLERIVDLRVKPWKGASDVNPFRISVQASGERTPDTAELTFILPVKGD